jgi:hypothetical protein
VRKHAVSLFFLVFFAHAYFVGALGWNQSARVGAILTFIEPGPNRLTLRIDEFVQSDARSLQTGDWARGADGHHYPNKAPGVSLIGIPAYAALYGLERLLDADPRSQVLTRLNTIVLNLWCSVAWTAAATVALYLFLGAGGLAHSEALLGTLAYAFGTLVFPYDTSIWGHSTAAACLLASLCLAAWPGGVRRALPAGLLGGLAVLLEYHALLALAAIGAVWLANGSRWRQRFEFAAAAALPMLGLLICQRLAFGGWLTTAISRGNPIFRDPTRAFGVLGGVDWSAAWGLLFSPWRGLFLYCPVLLFAFVGSRQLWREGRRTLVAASLAAFAASVLIVASFNAWGGGWASGARYLIVTISLLAVLAPRTSTLPSWARWSYHAALALSVFNMLALTAVEVTADEAERNPLFGLAYRELFSGAYPHDADSGNVGVLLGLAPPWDLALFLLVFGSWTFALFRSPRAAERRA